jgi:bacteriorhodopsin/DNA-binding NarL/FixJ family response regulator
MQIFDLICSILCFSFFAYQRLAKRRCKFEVLFVTFVGGFSDIMKITIATKVPASFSVGNSNRMVSWSRWAGWLSTCPVLLIHLSNLAGKEVFNARRMMKMLIAFQVMIMGGMTASMIESDWKYAFYLVGVSMISVIFKFAAEIFREAIATMPARAKNHLIRMAIVFFGSWSGFGFFFLLGPELSGVISKAAMLTGFAICDNISKNVYSWHGWYLRWNILRKHDNPEEFIEEDTEEVKQNYRVLLVETDPMFLYYFENILQHHNCKIDVASTTDIMMKKLEASVELDHEYDIMLVSFAMAKLNGFHLVKQVRSIAFMIPVIAYGRDIKQSDMQSRNVSGIDDYIKAPFADEEISTKLVRWSRRMSVDMNALTRVLTMDKERTSGFGTKAPPSSLGTKAPPSSLGKISEKPSMPPMGMPMHAVPEAPVNTLYDKLEQLMNQLDEVKAGNVRTSTVMEARLSEMERRLVNGLSPLPSPRPASQAPPVAPQGIQPGLEEQYAQLFAQAQEINARNNTPNGTPNPLSFV